MKRVAVFLVLLLAASPALAQYSRYPRFELGVQGGYTFSEGVETETFVIDGQAFDEVDPTSGASYGLSFAFQLNRYGEIGFMMNQQQSDLQIGGVGRERDVVGLDVNSYHGYGAYNFGLGDATVQPTIFFGMGATHYVTGEIAGQEVDNETRFSTTWGGGVKVYPDEHIGFKFIGQWTPTYIKSDAVGWWCDPFWGCYVVGDAQYANQFSFNGGVIVRF
jgi:hypothetical protein